MEFWELSDLLVDDIGIDKLQDDILYFSNRNIVFFLQADYEFIEKNLGMALQRHLMKISLNC